MDYAYALEKRLEWLRWAKDPQTYARFGDHFEPGSLNVYTQILQSGDTLYMNKRFCELVDLARHTIPDDLKFENEWMIAPNGFMWLEDPFIIPKPIIAQDPNIKSMDTIDAMKISAIGWQKITENHIAPISSTSKLELGSYQFVCFLNWRFFNPNAGQGFGMWSFFILNSGEVMIDRIRRFEKISLAATASAAYEQGRATDMMHEIRWIYSAMHLMSQKLATAVTHQAQRPTKRRMAKQNVPFVPMVKVITLRRLEEHKPTNQSREVDWQYQWPVSGHWRNQYFPSTDENRIIWIEDYIKGPEDKPLRPPQHKIYKVER